MGGKQSSVEETDPASPRSPTSPRVLPVDGGETSNYLINAVEAIIENRSQRTEQNLRAELAVTKEKIDAMEAKIDTLTKMLQTLIDKQP